MCDLAKITWKPIAERKFKHSNGFELWVYMRNQGRKEIFDKKTGKLKIKKYDLYPYSHYRYKRFLVQYIGAKECNAAIPTGAVELYKKFYNIFEKPYLGDCI